MATERSRARTPARSYNARSWSFDNFISSNKFSFGYYAFARLAFLLSLFFFFFSLCRPRGRKKKGGEETKTREQFQSTNETSKRNSAIFYNDVARHEFNSPVIIIIIIASGWRNALDEHKFSRARYSRFFSTVGRTRHSNLTPRSSTQQ